MRRMAVLCLLAMLLVPCAALAGIDMEMVNIETQEALRLPGGPFAVVPPQTEADRRAVVVTAGSDGTAALYAQPDERAEALMTYYSGATLEVLRPAGNGFYLVQIGTQGAGLMGYMRAQDMRIGALARRQVQPCFMRLEMNREVQVHAYPDEGAPVIGMCDPAHTYYAMGKNDSKWVQLFLPPQTHVWEEQDRMTCGFVRLETGAARGYWQELADWEAEPVEGEVSREQAIAWALEYLDGSGQGGMPEVYTQKSQLEQMDCRAFLRVHRSDPEYAVWWVYFWQREGSDAASVSLRLTPEGDVQAWQGYIAPQDWENYTVTPVL